MGINVLSGLIEETKKYMVDGEIVSSSLTINVNAHGKMAQCICGEIDQWLYGVTVWLWNVEMATWWNLNGKLVIWYNIKTIFN